MVIARLDVLAKAPAARDQVTVACYPSPGLWASSGELPERPIRLAGGGKAVKLPERFDPIP
jgi:hypothetical protein